MTITSIVCTTQDAGVFDPRFFSRASGILHGFVVKFHLGVFSVPIAGPFPDAALHAVQPPSVRSELSRIPILLQSAGDTFSHPFSRAVDRTRRTLPT